MSEAGMSRSIWTPVVRSKYYRSIWTPSEIFGPPTCSHFFTLGTAGWSTLSSFGMTVQASHS